MAVSLWSFAAHNYGCGYAPKLTAGRLVQKHDPAWQLPENGNSRAAVSLQRFVDARAAHPLLHKAPGYGLGYHHSREPRGEVAGYPDVHAWAPRPGAAMFRELKGMGVDPRPEQVATLDGLAATGADVGVWWPCCWYAGRIDTELAALAAAAHLIGGCWAPGLPPQPGQPGYIAWNPEQTPTPATARRRSRKADLLAPATPATARPAAELPGADLPPMIESYVLAGYAVPMPGNARASAASIDLDAWLRDRGFPPTAVPYPVRIVTTVASGVAVQCRVGGPTAPRVWRWAPQCRDLPTGLAVTLGAAIVYGNDAIAMLTDTDQAADRPAA
jgi:hypothetical protein